MEFYKRTGENKIQCLLCGHYCNISKNHVGICGINKNSGDKIECMVYGYPNAINIDPIEKKPLYHFLPNSKTFSIGTVGCNFKCSFCQNWQLSQSDDIDRSTLYMPKDIVNFAKHYECESISYTYSEPTIFFPYIFDIATLAHKEDIKNTMVTNGFESKEVREQMVGLIDAINVDLKSFDEKYYHKKLGGKLDVILDNLKFFSKSGIHMEITTLIVPTHNDSKEELEKIASFIADKLGNNTPWHILAFHPAYKEIDLPRTQVDTLLIAREIGYSKGIKNIHIGNIGVAL